MMEITSKEAQTILAVLDRAKKHKLNTVCVALNQDNSHLIELKEITIRPMDFAYTTVMPPAPNSLIAGK